MKALLLTSNQQNVKIANTVSIISSRYITSVQHREIITSHLTKASKHDTQINARRSFLVNTQQNDSSKRTGGTFYHEKIVIGYSREQMCDLVYDVAKYKEFVPFCTRSTILLKQESGLGKINLKKIGRTNMSLNLKNIDNDPQFGLPKNFRAQLDIGYPPIKESYISNVTSIHPMYVKSVSRDTNLFEYLTNEWKFHPNPQMYERAHLNSMTDLQLKEIEKSCLVEFYVSFKFVNSLYNSFSEMFMDQIFKKMVSAFTDRAAVLYGKPSILPKPVKI